MEQTLCNLSWDPTGGTRCDVRELRDDVPATELALYCLNAAAGARYAESHAAVRRMLDVAMTGLVRTARD